MATRKSMKADLSDKAMAEIDAKLAKISPTAAAHLVDFEAGVSRDAKKKTAAKRTTAKKTTTRKKK